MATKEQRIQAIFIKTQVSTHDDYLDALSYLKFKTRKWYNPMRWIKGKYINFFNMKGY